MATTASIVDETSWGRAAMSDMICAVNPMTHCLSSGVSCGGSSLLFTRHASFTSANCFYAGKHGVGVDCG